MQDLLQAVFLGFLDTIPGHLQIAVLDQIRHDFTLNGIVVFLCIDGVNQLHLQLCQFLAYPFGLQQFVDNLLLFRKSKIHIGLDGKHPTNQSTLANLFIYRFAVDIGQHSELDNVKLVHRRQHDRRNNELLVKAVNGGRQKQIGKILANAISPDTRCKDIIEELVHLLLVLLIELSALFATQMIRLKLKHRYLTDEVLHLLTDSC